MTAAAPCFSLESLICHRHFDFVVIHQTFLVRSSQQEKNMGSFRTHILTSEDVSDGHDVNLKWHWSCVLVSPWVDVPEPEHCPHSFLVLTGEGGVQ
jgi:hypothetical protein